jgi:hypothetical protein
MISCQGGRGSLSAHGLIKSVVVPERRPASEEALIQNPWFVYGNQGKMCQSPAQLERHRADEDALLKGG